jgi:hypothetical protein
MNTVQKTGFARFQVMALASQLGVDTHAAFAGNEISDMLVAGVCEQREKLYNVSMKGARSSLLLIDGKSVYVWKVILNGDTYERSVGAHSVRGSVALLKKVYGEKNIAVTDENGAKKVLAQKKADRGTLEFYNLSHLVAKEKVEKVKVEKVEKTIVKKKVIVKVKKKV